MKKLLIFMIGILMLSCSQSQEKFSDSAILISNVNIVDVRNGTITEGSHIVIDSTQIIKISEEAIDTAGFKTQIDGSGQFILPGLAEMHAHIPSPPTLQMRVEATLFLYLSNGITTVRGMLGNPAHLNLRKRAADQEFLSPRIYTSSPSLNGSTVKTPEEARAKVTTYAKAGYDFLKIHPGIKLEVFEELVKAARENEIPFAGHVPVDVGIVRALESEFATIDHIDGFVEGMVPESENVNPNANGFFGYKFTSLADTSKMEELVKLSAEKGVWMVPTQSLFERWYAPTTAEEMLSQPEMKYMPTSTLKSWRQRKVQATGPESEFDEELWNEFIEIRRMLIREIQENGKGLLLGSDAPQIFNVPGFSIHHEMEGMLKAGLSPLQIIQSGTINVAEYLGESDNFGEIKEGMVADVVLVGSNPLNDIKALRDIRGVMARGKWVSKEEIEQRLKEIEDDTY